MYNLFPEFKTIKVMWYVVCFSVDNTVFVIPDTWYNNGTSAWPKSFIGNKKRMIEKKIPPNDRDFDYYRCRILAKNIGILLFIKFFYN